MKKDLGSLSVVAVAVSLTACNEGSFRAEKLSSLEPTKEIPAYCMPIPEAPEDTSPVLLRVKSKDHKKKPGKRDRGRIRSRGGLSHRVFA